MATDLLVAAATAVYFVALVVRAIEASLSPGLEDARLPSRRAP